MHEFAFHGYMSACRVSAFLNNTQLRENNSVGSVQVDITNGVTEHNLNNARSDWRKYYLLRC